MICIIMHYVCVWMYVCMYICIFMICAGDQSQREHCARQWGEGSQVIDTQAIFVVRSGYCASQGLRDTGIYVHSDSQCQLQRGVSLMFMRN